MLGRRVRGRLGRGSGPLRIARRLSAGEPLGGSPEWWVETISGFVDDGFDTIVFWPVDPSPRQVDALVQEIAPMFRGSDWAPPRRPAWG